MLLLCVAIRNSLGERDPAKGNQPSTLRPMNGGVVYNVALLSDLYMSFELNCFSRQTFTELVTPASAARASARRGSE